MNRRKAKGVDTKRSMRFFCANKPNKNFFCFFFFAFPWNFNVYLRFERENVPGVPREDAQLKSKKGCKAFPFQ